MTEATAAVPRRDADNVVDLAVSVDGRPVAVDVALRAILGGRDVTASLQREQVPVSLFARNLEPRIIGRPLATRRSLASAGLVTFGELGGYAISAGSLVLICPYVLHRHPRHWTDPDRFDPERFAGATADRRHRFAYLPFGGGPRICIGNRFALLEARLVLSTLLSRYRLTRTDPAPVVARPSVTLRPRGGLRMRIERR